MNMETEYTGNGTPNTPATGGHISYRVSHFDPTQHSGEQIARAHKATRQWQADVQGVTFSNFYESWEELNTIEASYLRPGGNFFVAEDPATSMVIGHVGIKNGGDNVAILKNMGILPEYQGHGIGASLAIMALAWTQSRGFSRITLTTGEVENAIGFYEKFGFREIGRVLRNRDYVMELDLSKPNT